MAKSQFLPIHTQCITELFEKAFKVKTPVAEFKEFKRRFKFKPVFKYGWFHLKLYQMFQDLSRRLI